MLLYLAAALLFFWSFVLPKLRLDPARKRRVLLLCALTTVAAGAFAAMRLVPLAVLAVLIGGGLVANLVTRSKRAGARDAPPPGAAPPPRRPASMERAEALAILGLEGEPASDAIVAAHKRMILRAHPDQGGSDYMAAKVNQARQVLLGD